MPTFFEAGKQARISERAFSNMPPIDYPPLYAARGQVVTLVEFIEPNSDPGLWEVITDDGVRLYPLPSELECVDPQQEQGRRQWVAFLNDHDEIATLLDSISQDSEEYAAVEAEAEKHFQLWLNSSQPCDHKTANVISDTEAVCTWGCGHTIKLGQTFAFKPA